MIIRAFATALVVLSIADPLSGQDAQFRQRVRAGQDAIYRLDYPAAEKIFNQMKQESPDNPAAYGMLAFAAWHQLLFASRNFALHEYGIPTPFTDEPADLTVARSERARFVSANDALTQLCDRLLSRNPRDVLALYFKGFALENLATEAIALTKSTWKARGFGDKAKDIHEEVLKLDPSMIDANTSIGVYEYVAATLPWSYKWLAWLAGVRGDKDVALQRFRDVAAKGTYRAADAQVVMALLETWKGRSGTAVSVYTNLHKWYPQSFLIDIGLAVAHERNKDLKSALQVYQDLLRDLPKKAPGLQPGEVHFRIGDLYVRLREYGRALESFDKAVQSAQGDRETMPLAYYRMAEIREERGETAQAMDAYRKVLEYSGNALQDEIAHARKKLRK